MFPQVDKKQAIKDYHFEQQHLLALIGKYDNFIKNNKEERYTTAHWDTPRTSEVIYKITKGM